MGLEMQLMATVKPGTVSTNFEQFKEEVRRELEENYKTIVVTEEQLENARKARAKLNKAKDALKATMRSAQTENDEPLKVAKAQAKELEALLDDAILTLDTQIKTIEEKQRSERMRKATNLLATKIENKKDDRLSELCGGCLGWMVNPKWANAGCSFTQVNSDCDEAIERCRNALELLQGPYRTQMLAEFQKTGDLAKAQLLGVQMAKDEERLAQLSAPQQEQATVPNKEIKLVYENEVPAGKPQISLDDPKTYIEDERSERSCYADFHVTCKRYQMAWLLAICEIMGISLKRLDR